MNIGCLVDIDGGKVAKFDYNPLKKNKIKDLANILVEKAETLYVEDIRDYIKERAVKIKKKEDQEHKDQTNIMKALPSR